jgi:hypothetical protein
MKVAGHMLTILRAIAEEADRCELGAGYAEIAKATDLTNYLLMSKTSRLKARGLIERVNPEAPRCEHAYFKPTAAGHAALRPLDPYEPSDSVSTVQLAIQRRPQLAMVWARA